MEPTLLINALPVNESIFPEVAPYWSTALKVSEVVPTPQTMVPKTKN
jgi:hypothetical protein